MKTLCRTALIFLSVLTVGCKPKSGKTGAGANPPEREAQRRATRGEIQAGKDVVDRFCSACRDSDFSSIKGMLTGDALASVPPILEHSPQSAAELSRMVSSGSLFDSFHPSANRTALSYTARIDGKPALIEIAVLRDGDQWKIEDIRINNEGLKKISNSRSTIECSFRLKKIGLAIIQYRQQANAFPPSLQALVQRRLTQIGDLKCPGADSNRECDYFYLSPTAQAAIIACDLAGNHGDVRGVLIRDGSVLQMDVSEFEKRLKEPRHAEFARAIAVAEGR